MLLALVLLACEPPGGLVTAKPSDVTDTATTTTEDSAEDTAQVDTTVEVSHPREMRGLFVATVWNIDWPSRTGLSASAQQAEIVALLDHAQAANMNAVYVQLRPEGDALYASSLEPWSKWLTGTQGVDPGYDPLQTWLDEAHARNIEVHGWLNPYRARAGSESTSGLAAGHPARDFPTYTYAYGGDVWLDPAAAPVRQRVLDVIADLVDNYAIDGVVFDDYFYPYPDDGDFPDDATWNAYRSGGGTLSRADWRRENTATLIGEVHDLLATTAPEVRFGVSPFGIWRPGHPAGISGLDPYESLYADPLHWIEEGWLDYVAPQLYWETGNSGQEYGLLLPWWDDQLSADTYLFPANYLSQLGTSSTWTLAEFTAQVDIARDPDNEHTAGQFWYSASPLLDGASGLADALLRWYPSPVLPPTVQAVKGNVVAPPEVRVSNGTLSWTARAGLRAVCVYVRTGDAWILQAIVPADAGSMTLPAGEYAVSAVDEGDVESRGVVVISG